MKEYAKVAAFLIAESESLESRLGFSCGIHKIIEISALPLGGTTNLALAFTGKKTFCQAFVQFLIFGWSEIRITGNSFPVGNAMVQQLIHLNRPCSGRGSDNKYITNLYGS